MQRQLDRHASHITLATSQCAKPNAFMCVVVSSAACMTQKRGGCHWWETRMLLKAVCAWDDIHISVQTLIAIVITAWILSTHS